MTAIILTWNPDRWQEWDFQAAREQVVETGQFLSQWNVSPHQKIPVGTDTWLLLQGGHGKEFIGPGLIGHGKTRSEPHPGLRAEGADNTGPDNKGADKTGLDSSGPDNTGMDNTGLDNTGADNTGPDNTARDNASPINASPDNSSPDDASLYVDVAFDAFLPFGEQLAPEMLLEAVPGVPWESVQGSGLALEPDDEARVRQLWSEFCPPPVADPTLPAPGTYPDEALSRVEVNRYERSPEARRACLAHHGTVCAACGFSFEITYGEIGKNFIQVHHIVPVSQLGSDYVLDPVTDLVPLCANCHAMAHHGVSIPRTIAELRRIIADAGYLKGQALTPSELEAQRDARRILGQP